MEDKQIFIGKQALVTKALNKSLIGLKGLIVNETKNTFVFRVKDSDKTVLKSGVSLLINGQEYQSNSKRIEERIKSR